jgi:hypothetical protein
MKIVKIFLAGVLFFTTLPKISVAGCAFKKPHKRYHQVNAALHRQIMPMYLPIKRQEFEAIYKASIQRKYIPSQKLVSLEKRMKSWPKERRKNYQAQLDAAEAKLYQLNKPYKQQALINLYNRINALKFLTY